MKALAAALMLATAAQAQPSTTAAALDVASTAVSIAIGATEANPIGLATIPLKLAAIAHANTLPEGERQEQHLALATVWRGAAVNNLCVIAAIVTGGAFAPACIALGAVSVVKDYLTDAEQRQFWAICAAERASNPRIRCTYTTTPA